MKRPDIVTIDGPSGCGKNSVGERLAAKLGFTFFDAGTIYRLITKLAIKKGFDLKDGKSIRTFFDTKDVGMRYQRSGDRYRIYAEDIDYTDNLHDPELSTVVPIISSQQLIREIVEELQARNIEKGYIVMTGRNVGADVAPEAGFKVWLCPPIEKRALWRHLDQYSQESNLSKEVHLEQVCKNMAQRDHLDFNREFGKMRPAEDAITCESSIFPSAEAAAEYLHKKHIEMFGEMIEGSYVNFGNFLERDETDSN
jgi:cytidylate kinase